MAFKFQKLTVSSERNIFQSLTCVHVSHGCLFVESVQLQKIVISRLSFQNFHVFSGFVELLLEDSGEKAEMKTAIEENEKNYNDLLERHFFCLFFSCVLRVTFKLELIARLASTYKSAGKLE